MYGVRALAFESHDRKTSFFVKLNWIFPRYKIVVTRFFPFSYCTHPPRSRRLHITTWRQLCAHTAITLCSFIRTMIHQNIRHTWDPTCTNFIQEILRILLNISYSEGPYHGTVQCIGGIVHSVIHRVSKNCAKLFFVKSSSNVHRFW